MSRRDEERYLLTARSFLGRRVCPTVAVSTLKLTMDGRHPGSPYIWIDAPWLIRVGSSTVLSSDQHPDPDDPEYKMQFQQFCLPVSRLEGVAFLDVLRLSSGTVEFRFADGFTIAIPPRLGPTSDNPEDWYDDWYVMGANPGTP